MQFPSGRLGLGTEFIDLEVWKYGPRSHRGLWACVGRYVVLMSQVRKDNVVIKDIKSFVLGITQLYSRSQAGLPAAHAGLRVIGS